MSKSRKGRRDDEQQPDDDRPMTEEQWEAMMKESDLRAARYGELLETFMDHPDRDEIVAREMGWGHIADELAADKAGEEWKRAGEGQDDAGDEGPPAWEEGDDAKGEMVGGDDADDPFADPPAEGGPDEMEEEDRPVESIPAYNLAFEAAMRVFHAFKPYFDERQDADDEDPVVLQLQAALSGIQIAGAKIAGGHGMGYDDDALCGNIVCCRKALEGAEQSVRGLEALKAGGVVPADLCDSLLADVVKSRQAIADRIAELRARVWW